MSESELQDAVIEAMRLLGWRVAHFRPALTKHGWRTPVSADGKGFPDVLAVRERVIAVEFKADKGKTSPDQDEWLDAFGAAGIEVYVWRPSDWTSGAVDAIIGMRR